MAGGGDVSSRRGGGGGHVASGQVQVSHLHVRTTAKSVSNCSPKCSIISAPPAASATVKGAGLMPTVAVYQLGARLKLRDGASRPMIPDLDADVGDKRVTTASLDDRSCRDMRSTCPPRTMRADQQLAGPAHAVIGRPLSRSRTLYQTAPQHLSATPPFQSDPF